MSKTEEEALEICWTSNELLSIKQFTRRVWKNIILISIVFLLNFVSFGGLTRLQSTLHLEDGMGVICTSILYVCFLVSCLIFPKVLIHWVGHKWVITLSLIGYILWMAANAYGIWGTMIPASILGGVFAAPLWTAQSSYITELAKIYATVTHKTDSEVMSLFFGVFFMFFQSSNILGDIISYTILKQAPPENYTSPSSNEVATLCGVNQCPLSNSTSAGAEDTPVKIVWILCGVYLAIAILGLSVSIIFVDSLPQACQDAKKTQKAVCKQTYLLIASTMKHFKKRRQLLLMPLTFYNGISETFLNADWNKSWVACTSGIWMIGLVHIPFAVCSTASSLIGGRLHMYTGRVPLFIAGLAIASSIQITLVFWTVDLNRTAVFYGIMTLWGISDAIWSTQVNALYGSIFDEDSESAFSNYHLWSSLGFAVAFGYSHFLCTSVKLYIMFCILWIGLAGYFLVEWDLYRSRKGETLEQSDNQKCHFRQYKFQ